MYFDNKQTIINNTIVDIKILINIGDISATMSLYPFIPYIYPLDIDKIVYINKSLVGKLLNSLNIVVFIPELNVEYSLYNIILKLLIIFALFIKDLTLNSSLDLKFLSFIT